MNTIEVYICADDDCEFCECIDGNILFEGRNWDEAVRFTKKYRIKHAEEMRKENWGIMCYDTVTGACY